MPKPKHYSSISDTRESPLLLFSRLPKSQIMIPAKTRRKFCSIEKTKRNITEKVGRLIFELLLKDPVGEGRSIFAGKPAETYIPHYGLHGFYYKRPSIPETKEAPVGPWRSSSSASQNKPGPDPAK
ncbi:MAG: hypothetical protein N3D11_09235 [Candidatus Sumerlaeia bacterium]|nr:hypothetical protein [Candidatus Sumerlaeia bacterium]